MDVCRQGVLFCAIKNSAGDFLGAKRFIFLRQIQEEFI